MLRTIRLLAPLALLLGVAFVANCDAGVSCGVGAPHADTTSSASPPA